MVDTAKGLDDRIVRGYLVTWNTRNSHGEKFIKGAFAKSIRDNGPGSGARMEIKFLNNHRISEACANFEILREDDFGVYFETKPLDPVTWADNLLIQLRSGTVNSFSIGWDYVWDKMEWDDSDDSLVVYEGKLFEGSAVALASDENTYAIRSLEEEAADIHDEIDKFIGSIPRAFQLQARKLFTSQKSLSEIEPLQRKRETLKKSPTKPAMKKVDYTRLSKHL